MKGIPEGDGLTCSIDDEDWYEPPEPKKRK